MQSIYLDNAATSFPKPAGVSDSMKRYLDCVGATINRSVYGRAQEAGLETLALRESLARLFRFPEPATHVVLTPGATFGLNLVIKGLLRPGDHCIVSGMEHNAVMRPLQQLGGVEFDRIPCDSEGFLQHGALESLFRPNTRLVVLAHASNVCGSVQDAAAVGAACARHGCFFLLDGAQTAGHYPIDFAALRLSALAVPGHKGLLGPSGIGALLLTDELAANLTPLVAGGPAAPRTVSCCRRICRTGWNPARRICRASTVCALRWPLWSSRASSAFAAMSWRCASAFWTASRRSPASACAARGSPAAAWASSPWTCRAGTMPRRRSGWSRSSAS